MNSTTIRRKLGLNPLPELLACTESMADPDVGNGGPKELVLCFDGTGYKFNGDESDSNVLKVFRVSSSPGIVLGHGADMGRCSIMGMQDGVTISSQDSGLLYPPHGCQKVDEPARPGRYS